jgi:hypothetical protein
MSEFNPYLPTKVLRVRHLFRKALSGNEGASVGHHPGVRLRILAIVGVVSLASAAAVFALASSSANGLPSYTNGYAQWPRINKKPFTRTGPLSSAHAGVKNVYASKRKLGARHPNGTVIVKTIQPASEVRQTRTSDRGSMSPGTSCAGTSSRAPRCRRGP